MKVILSQDVAKLGRRYDVVDVPTGRAMNMLIPNGLAKPATPENIKRIKAQSEKVAAVRAADAKAFAAAIEKLDGSEVEVVVDANKKGHLFEALKETAVAEALSKKGVTITPTQVIIPAPIKELGTHSITLNNGDERIDVQLNLVAA